jgi:hypothetical protein
VKVKLHSGCIGQEQVAIQQMEPPAPKCFCKKLIEYAEANELVRTGAAKWVVTKRSRGMVESSCPLCVNMTDVEKKTCAQCKGTGKVMEPRVWEEYNNDVVLMSSTPIDNKGRYRMNTREKTPRVATVEGKHIFRAIIENLRFAAQRIEEYGDLIQLALQDLGAQIRRRRNLEENDEPEIIFLGHPEPADDHRKHQGRKYDMGEPVISQIGMEAEATEEQEELIKDPIKPESVVQRWNNKAPQLLLAYSLQKVREGDATIGATYVIAAGIAWKRTDPEIREILGE